MLFLLNHKSALAKIVTNAALIGRESRGSHYREDFTNTNQEQFNKCILIRKDDRGISYRWENIN